MSKIGIFYGSTSGNTESVAEQIQKEFGADNAELINVESFDINTLNEYNNLILGTSTWGVGDLQDDWDGAIDDLKSANLSGKKVAFFGCGDSQSYSDTFANGMSFLYEAVKGNGAELIGRVPTEGYFFDESDSVVDGEFVGLAIDEDNESDQTPERIKNWVENLKKGFN